MAIGKIETVLIDVKDLRKAIPFFEELLGIKFDAPSTNVLGDGTEIEAAWCPAFGLELIEQMKPRIDRDGMRGFSVRVPDVEQAKAHLAKSALKPIAEVKSERFKEHEAVYVLNCFRFVLTEHEDY